MLKHEALRNCFLVNILDGGIASPSPDVFSSEDLLLVFMSVDARAVLECLGDLKKIYSKFFVSNGFYNLHVRNSYKKKKRPIPRRHAYISFTTVTSFEFIRENETKRTIRNFRPKK